MVQRLVALVPVLVQQQLLLLVLLAAVGCAGRPRGPGLQLRMRMGARSSSSGRTALSCDCVLVV
jgi:hypothetical protein